MNRALLQQVLEVLENSSDIVWNAYLSDWRHGSRTRKAQLDSLLKNAENHDETIIAIKALLAKPVHP